MGRGDFVSVGETLAEARSRAGLSVDELSERTRIRGTVIRCIEQDDYDACGGDVFVRGYVRALAGAVGIDAQPLIREYDRTRGDNSGDTFAHVARVADPMPPTGPPAAAADLPAADPDLTSADLPPVSADPAITAFDLPVVTEDPAPTVADLPVIPAGPPVPPPPPPPLPSPSPSPSGRRGDLPGDWTPVPPRTPGRRRTRNRDRRRVARIAIPAALVLAAAGIAAGLALSSQPVPSGKNAAAVTQPSTHAAHAPLASEPATPASATPTPSTVAPAPAQPAIRALYIASAEGFGPGGIADGDNSRIASYAITRGAPAPWQSQWYATAQFGNLKKGTGLLLDLGRTATITSVRIDLASYRGANLQLRVGDTAGSLSGFRVAAVADDVGGTVRLHLQTPEQARYVLIWFTLLPPNGAGQYQASVYHVVVNGRP
jgi:eukaryotic-like serine/threonine-protein kinase